MDFRKIFRNVLYGTSVALALLSFPNPVSSYVNSFAPKNNVEIVESSFVRNNGLEGIVESKDSDKIFNVPFLGKEEEKSDFEFYSPISVASYNIQVVRRINKDNKVKFYVYSEDPDLRRLKTTVNNLNNNNFKKDAYDLCKAKGFDRIVSDKTLSELIRFYSSKLDVDENLVYAIVNNESLGFLNYDSDVAVAPMHVTFDTFDTLRRKYNLKNINLCDVEDNVYLGVLYIRDSIDLIKSISEKHNYESFPLRILFASYYVGTGVIYDFVNYVDENKFDVSSLKRFDEIAESYLEQFYSNKVVVYANRALNTFAAFKNGNYRLSEKDITNKVLKENN